MRVAVTGANGLLGGEAVMRLAGCCDVLAVGRSVEDALRDFGPHAVLHAGAATDVDSCERDPDLAWRVTVGGTEQVATTCRSLGARLVAVSTDYVFDGQAGPYDEAAIPNPQGVYARTKRCKEEVALVLVPDCAVARVAVVYSGRPGAKPTFATQVVEKLARGEPVHAFSDQLVSTTLAANGAAMCLELLLETSYHGVLHTSDASVFSRVEFAKRVAERFALRGNIVPVRTRRRSSPVSAPAPRRPRRRPGSVAAQDKAARHRRGTRPLLGGVPAATGPRPIGRCVGLLSSVRNWRVRARRTPQDTRTTSRTADGSLAAGLGEGVVAPQSRQRVSSRARRAHRPHINAYNGREPHVSSQQLRCAATGPRLVGGARSLL
jgi:dTDP-4-dehydrorhamnose reductase